MEHQSNIKKRRDALRAKINKDIIKYAKEYDLGLFQATHAILDAVIIPTDNATKMWGDIKWTEGVAESYLDSTKEILSSVKGKEKEKNKNKTHEPPVLNVWATAVQEQEEQYYDLTDCTHVTVVPPNAASFKAVATFWYTGQPLISVIASSCWTPGYTLEYSQDGKMVRFVKESTSSVSKLDPGKAWSGQSMLASYTWVTNEDGAEVGIPVHVWCEKWYLSTLKINLDKPVPGYKWVHSLAGVLVGLVEV